jgi:hypothetical protein
VYHENLNIDFVSKVSCFALMSFRDDHIRLQDYERSTAQSNLSPALAGTLFCDASLDSLRK